MDGINTMQAPPLSIIGELGGICKDLGQDLVSDLDAKLAAWMHLNSEVCSVKINDALMDLNYVVSSIKMDAPTILIQDIGVPASSLVEKSKQHRSSKMRARRRRRQLLPRRFRHLRLRIKFPYIVPIVIVGGR